LGAIFSPFRVYCREEGTLQQLVQAFPVHHIHIAGRNTATGEVTEHDPHPLIVRVRETPH